MQILKSYVGCLAVLIMFVGGFLVFRFGLGEDITNNTVKFGMVGLGLILIFAGPGIALSIVGESSDSKSPYAPRRTSEPKSSAYPVDWENLRRRALGRDGYRCGNCESTSNLHVHHIVPLSKGGTNNLSNLRALCNSCHKKLHPHMRG